MGCKLWMLSSRRNSTVGGVGPEDAIVRYLGKPSAEELEDEVFDTNELFLRFLGLAVQVP